jgi:hypothetical protein
VCGNSSRCELERVVLYRIGPPPNPTALSVVLQYPKGIVVRGIRGSQCSWDRGNAWGA